MRPNDFSIKVKRNRTTTRIDLQTGRTRMKRATATAALLFMAATPSLAHEGGSHKSVKGTVRSMGDREVVVRTIEGKEQTILLDKDTACRDRLDGDASCSDVKEGDRVVVVTRSAKGGKTIADKIRFSHGGGKPTDAEHGGHQHHDH